MSKQRWRWNNKSFVKMISGQIGDLLGGAVECADCAGADSGRELTTEVLWSWKYCFLPQVLVITLTNETSKF